MLFPLKGSEFLCPSLKGIPMIVVLGGPGREGLHQSVSHLQGKEVQLIEHGGIGGQCLHFGCMPVCALNDVARTIHSVRIFQHLGLIDSSPTINFLRMLEEMHSIQTKIASILDTETTSAGVEITYGKSPAGLRERPYLSETR